ncbi:uncharacterized protein A4U43_C03F30830 [Asparagus officinalis]|uniref:KIB1-4 beta-propeller domain-containing protein n=1 Tax=Asparagus officinalis TaxID=4686 RepID=A0A5P1FEY6_ASPOF|nr:uncharacterized protein A4U43_C03F30830 [Asparagus officinalis]
MTGCKASMSDKLLVESAAGDQIFMLDFPIDKEKLDVIRIDLHDLESAVLEPVIVNDLGDNIFFASLRATFSVSAARFPELRRNCIYFCGYIPFPQFIDEYDVGVFDLKDESTKPLPNFTSSVGSSPIWIIPTPQ